MRRLLFAIRHSPFVLIVFLCAQPQPGTLSPTRPEPPPRAERPLEEWMGELLDRLSAQPAADLPAGWDTGLLMLGLLEAGEALARPQSHEEAAAWLRRHRPALENPKLEHVALAAPAIRLGRSTGDPQWNDYPQRLWSWLFEQAPRAYNAGLFYEGRRLALNTLYPLPSMLVEWQDGNGNSEPVRFAVWQWTAHLAHLEDLRSGLLRHMWNADQDRVEGELWGQGNARALLGLAETVRRLRPDAKQAPALRRRWHVLAEAVLKAQRPSGAWGLLLDGTDSPDDFLATALMLAALETYPWEDLELFPREAADRGFRWVAEQVDESGAAPPVYPALLAGYRGRYLRATPRPSPAGDGTVLLLLSARWRRLQGEKLREGMQPAEETEAGRPAPRP